MLKSFQSQPQIPTDPNIMAQVNALTQTSMAETQRKAAIDNAEIQLKAQKQNQEAADKESSIISNQQIETAKLTHDVNALTIEKQFEAKQAEAERAHQAQLASQQHVQEMQQAAQEAQQNQIQQAAQQPEGESNV